MGVRIEDPGQVEGMQTATDGLGLLPLVTVMQDAKVVCQSHFRFKNYESDCAGYQIHMGTTTPLHAGGRQTTLNTLADGTTDGYRLNADCWGSYMHGILDNPVVLDDLAAGFGVAAGSGFDYRLLKNGNTTFWPVRYGKLSIWTIFIQLYFYNYDSRTWG